MSESVREQTAAIALGNTEAFARFFQARSAQLYAEARSVTRRDESFCLDVVQDAMIRVIRTIKPVNDEVRLRAWLRVVVRACAYDRLRKELRQRRREEAVRESSEAVEEEAALDEQVEWLRQELGNMDEPAARLMLMRYRLGWTLQRIGEAVGLRPGAVDGRIGRTVATLRRRAQETFHD